MGEIVDVLLSHTPGDHVPHHHGDPQRVGFENRWGWSCRCGAKSVRSDMSLGGVMADYHGHMTAALKDEALSLREEREDYRKAVSEKDAEIGLLRSALAEAEQTESRLRSEVERLTGERDDYRSKWCESVGVANLAIQSVRNHEARDARRRKPR